MNNLRFNHEVAHIIAVFEAKATHNTEAIKVIVREWPLREEFEIFVDGGLLGDGRGVFFTKVLGEALGVAAAEVGFALQGN